MSSIRFGVYALSLAVIVVAPFCGRTVPALCALILASITGIAAAWSASSY